MAGEYSALTVAVQANTQMMAKQVAQAAVSSGDEAGRSMGQRISSGLGSVAKGIGNTLATGFTVATGAAAAFTGAVIVSGKSYNTLYQTSTAAMKTVLGSTEAAKAMMDEVSAFAKTSPFPRQAFIQATQQMLAFGFAAKDVVPTLGAIQDAVAAAGGGAQQITEVVDVLSKVQSTGKFTAETLNQLGYRGINAAELIGAAMGKTGAQIRSDITEGTLDSGAALTALTTQMNAAFGGAAANVKNTWTGAADRVKGAMRDIGSAIVEPFISKGGGGLALDWANKFADLLRAIEPLITPIVNAFVGQLLPVIAKIGPLFDGIITKVQGFGAAGGGGIASLMSSFSSLAPILGTVGGLLLKMGGANLAGAFGPLGGLISSVTGALGPFGGLIAGLLVSMPEFQAVIGQLMGVFAQLGPPIMSVVQALAGALGPALGQIVGALGGVVSQLLPVFTPLLGTLQGILVPVLTQVGSIFAQLMQSIGPLIPVIGDMLVGALQTVAPLIGAVTDILGGVLAPLLPSISAILQTVGRSFLSLLPAIQPLIDLIGSTLMSAFEAVMPAIEKVAVLLSDTLAQVIPILIPIITTLAGVLSKVLGGAIDAVMPIIEQVADLFASLVAQVLPPLIPIINQVAGIFAQLVTAAMPIVDILMKLVSQVFAALMPILPMVVQLIMQLVTAFFNLWPVLSPVIDLLLKLVTDVLSALTPMLQPIIDLLMRVVTVFVDLLPAIMPLLPVVQQLISALLPPLVSLLEMLLPPVMQLITWIAQLVTVIVNFAAMLISKVVTAVATVLRFFVELPMKIWSGLSALPGIIGRAFDSAMRWMVDTVTNVGKGVLDWFSNLPDKIKNLLSGAGSWLLNAGKKIVQGLIDGITGMIGKVGDAIGKVASKIKGFLPFSPAKEGPLHDHPPEESGKAIGGLIAEGLTSSTPAVDAAMTNLLTTPSPSAFGSLPVGAVPMGAAAATTAGSGPAVVVENANFATELDIEHFLRQAAWAAQTQMA
jgi:tape measure domain-containing protein